MRPTQRIRQFLKILVAEAARRSGMLAGARRQAAVDRGAVLMYHGVLGPSTAWDDYSADGMTVRERTFAMHMDVLARDFVVVPLAEMVDRGGRSPDPRRPLCTVTFDDGWKDFVDHAIPALRRHRLRSTLFVCSHFIDGRPWYWEERIKYLVSRLRACPGPSRAHWPFADPTDDERTLRALIDAPSGVANLELLRLVQRLRARPADVRAGLIDRLEALARTVAPERGRLFLTWDELRSLPDDGVELAAHTASHPNLTLCDTDEVRREISGGRERVREMTGVAAESFAYPYGKYDDRAVEVVKELGFRRACSTVGGWFGPGGDAYLVPRVNLHEDVAPTRAMFACRALRFLNAF